MYTDPFFNRSQAIRILALLYVNVSRISVIKHMLTDASDANVRPENQSSTNNLFSNKASVPSIYVYFLMICDFMVT